MASRFSLVNEILFNILLPEEMVGLDDSLTGTLCFSGLWFLLSSHLIHLISSSVVFQILEVVSLIGGESVVFCLMEEGMHSRSIVGVHQRSGSVHHCVMYFCDQSIFIFGGEGVLLLSWLRCSGVIVSDHL